MSFVDALRGEVRKAWTLRSLTVTCGLTVALTLAYCLIEARPDLGFSTPETAGVYAMANLSFFAAIVGVLIASSEYGGGQLTSSALATPRRGQMLAAKLLLSVVLTTGLGLCLAVFIATVVQAPLGDRSVYVTGDQAVLFGSLALGVLSWTVLGVLSTCAAIVIRSQTIAIASMIVLSFGGVPLMIVLPLFQYLPTNASVLMFIDREQQTSGWISPPDITVPVAVLTVAIWCAIAIIGAFCVFLRRDVGSRQATIE